MSNRLNDSIVALLVVGVGGMCGVALRYVCIVFLAGAALWIANIVGSFLLAYVNERIKQQLLRLFVMTGMLGSFTTFSSVSYEAVVLWQQSMMTGVLYSLAMTLCCIVAAFAGAVVGKR